MLNSDEGIQRTIDYLTKRIEETSEHYPNRRVWIAARANHRDALNRRRKNRV